MNSEVDLTGVNELTYPHLTTWEWPVAAYLFIGGLVAGIMILGGALNLRRRPIFEKAVWIADVSGLPLLVLGLLLLFVDLTNKWQAWRFFTTFQATSAMSWGSWILLLSGLVLFVRALRRLPAAPGFSWLDGGKWRRRVQSLLLWARRHAARISGRAIDGATVALGLGLGFYTGVLLSSISARPLWNTAVLAPLFLVSGLASGGAFLCLFISREAHMKLVPISLGLCGAEGLLLLAYIVSLTFGTFATQNAGDALLSGGFGLSFWLLVVVLGLLVPVLVEAADWQEREVPRLLERSAPVFKLVGSATLRFVVVFAGLQTFI